MWHEVDFVRKEHFIFCSLSDEQNNGLTITDLKEEFIAFGAKQIEREAYPYFPDAYLNHILSVHRCIDLGVTFYYVILDSPEMTVTRSE